MLEGYYHTLSDAVRSIEWWFLDDEGLNMANWLEGSWDAESFSARIPRPGICSGVHKYEHLHDATINGRDVSLHQCSKCGTQIGKVKGRALTFVHRIGWDAESFNAPYAGAGALMPIKGDTALSSFSGKELAQSSAIHGDFNQASLNYSGHQNLEVRGAEENRFPYPEAQVTNIVRVKDKAYVTIRYPDTDEHYGYEKIMEVDMEDVMLAESFGADTGCKKHFWDLAVRRNPISGENQFFNQCVLCGQKNFSRGGAAMSDFGAESFGAESYSESDLHDLIQSIWDGLGEAGRNEHYELFREYFGEGEEMAAEYGKRQRFGNRYVARNTKGEFISNVGVGASLKADRRNKSKTPARSGFGNMGDSQKGAVVDSSGKSLVGLGLLVGGVWALLDSRGTQSIK